MITLWHSLYHVINLIICNLKLFAFSTQSSSFSQVRYLYIKHQSFHTNFEQNLSVPLNILVVAAIMFMDFDVTFVTGSA